MNNSPSPQEPSAQAMDLAIKLDSLIIDSQAGVPIMALKRTALAIDAHCAKQVDSWKNLADTRLLTLNDLYAERSLLRARANLADEMAALLTEFLAVLENRASVHVVMYSERVVPFIPRIRSALNKFNSAKAGQK